HTERTAGDRASIGVGRCTCTADTRAATDLRVDRRPVAVGIAGVGVSGPGEHRLEVGADHAVLGRGARVDVEVLTSAAVVVVAQAVVRAGNAVDGVVIGAVAGKYRLGAQIAAE